MDNSAAALTKGSRQTMGWPAHFIGLGPTETQIRQAGCPCIRTNAPCRQCLRICFDAFHKKRNLELHGRLHDRRKRSYGCYLCNNIFRGRDSIKRHFQICPNRRPRPGCQRPTGSCSTAETTLGTACFEGDSEYVGIHLSRGADPNEPDSYGNTPLFWAAFDGNKAVIQMLLDHGADHTRQDYLGWTALQWAVARYKKSAAQLLIKHIIKFPMLKNASFDKVTQHHRGDTILRDIRLPLETGSNRADVITVDRVIATMLLTADDEDIDLLNNLWAPGHFDTPVKNQWRWFSAGEQPTDTDQYLRANTRHLTCADRKARVLQIAIRDRNLEAISVAMQFPGADPNHSLRQGLWKRTALHAAAFQKDPFYAHLLLDRGAMPSDIDEQGMAPLQVAVLNGFEETAAALLRGGADVNVKSHGKDWSHRRGYFEFYCPYPEQIPAEKTPLMLACGLLAPKTDPGLPGRMIDLLLSYGASVAATDKYGRNSIHFAAHSCNVDIVKHIIAAGGDCRAIDRLGKNAIHQFCLGHSRWKATALPGYKQGPYMEPCLQVSIMPDMRPCLDALAEHCGSSALSTVGSMNCLRKDPDSYSDVDRTIISNMTPLYCTLYHGDWQLFDVLKHLGAEIIDHINLEPLLLSAIENLQPHAMAFLLRHGARLNIETLRLKSNLLWSSLDSTLPRGRRIYRDKIEPVLDYVVSLGVDLDTIRGPKGTTLLHKAVEAGATKLTSKLLQAGADPCKVDDRGMDAFVHACVSGKYEDLRCLLAGDPTKRKHHWTQRIVASDIARDSPVDTSILVAVCTAMTNSSGFPAKAKPNILHLAAWWNNPAMVKALLSLGCNPDGKDKNGHTALNFAVILGHIGIASVLIEHGAKPDIPDNWGRRALHLAALVGCLPIVKLLLSAGVDPKAQDTFGWCPIHYAAHRAHAKVVEALVGAGADVHAITRFWPGWLQSNKPSGLCHNGLHFCHATPLHIAVISASRRAVWTILEAGARVDAQMLLPGYSSAKSRALDIILGHGRIEGQKEERLGENMLDIAQMLIQRGADVSGVADGFQVADVMGFEGHKELWDALRAGMS